MYGWPKCTLCYAVFLSDASHVCFVLVTYNGCSSLLLGKFYFILMTSNFSINLKVKNLLRWEQMGTGNVSGIMKIYLNWIVRGAQFFKFIKDHWTVCFKRTEWMACNLHLNKTPFFKKKNFEIMLIDYGGKFSFLDRLKISYQKALKGVALLPSVGGKFHPFLPEHQGSPILHPAGCHRMYGQRGISLLGSSQEC